MVGGAADAGLMASPRRVIQTQDAVRLSVGQLAAEGVFIGCGTRNGRVIL